MQSGNNSMVEVLQSYFEDKVVISRDEKDRVLDQAMTVVNDIIKFMNGKNRIFSINPVGVGSYYQYLKENKANEFDLNIPLNFIGRLYPFSESGRLCCFKFNKDVDENIPTLREDVKIVKCVRPRPSQGVEYVYVRLRPPVAAYYVSLTHEEYLFPYDIKIEMKRLILEAIEHLKLKGVSLGNTAHGPALTITVYLGSSRVNFDLSAVIQAQIPFNEHSDWIARARKIGWPDEKLIKKICEIGVDLVAKGNFAWTLSFARCDKALVKEIDNDDTIRRKVHRIMKCLLREAESKGASSELTSYMMKNAWLWECERLNDDSSWQPGQIYKRYDECMNKLWSCLNNKHLPVYFCPKINLLRDKTEDELNDMKKTVRMMKEILESFRISRTKKRKYED